MARIKKTTILILISLFILNSCSLYIDTIKIEVNKNYTGWCYIIPVNDTSSKKSAVTMGKYQADENGVVHIPESLFNIKKDYIVKVYDSSIDISESMRYSGNVKITNSDNNKYYRFIRFYLPSMPERKIPDNTQYWRDKMYEYRKVGSEKFDSLLKAKKIFAE